MARISPVVKPVDAGAVKAKLRASLDKVFDEMDIDGDGKVMQSEFASYLQHHPTGWPLAELLQGHSVEKKNELIQFWFRKLDLSSQGTLTKTELFIFYEAMQSSSSFKEETYAEFIISLFDTDFDDHLSQFEVHQMLSVLLGKEPSPQLIQRVMCTANSNAGLDKKALAALLHEIHCNFGELEKIRSGGTGELFFTIGGVLVAIVAGLLAYRFVVKRHSS